MRQIALLVYYDFKIYLQDKRAIVLMLVLPLLFIMLVGYGAAPLLERNTFIEPFPVALVDQENNIETRTLINHFENTPAFQEMVQFIKTNREEALSLLKDNKTAAVIFIPEGFVSKMEHGENLPFTVIGNPRRPLQSAVIKNMMQSASNLVSAAQSGVNTVLHYMREAEVSRETYNYWYNKSVKDFSLRSLGRNEIFLVESISATGKIATFEYYSLAVGMVFLLILGMGGLQLIIRDKENGIFSRLKSHGLSIWKLLLSKVIVLSILQLVQLTAVFSLLSIFTTINYQGSIFWSLLVVMAIFAAVAALFILVAAVSPNTSAANLISLAIIAIFSVMGGSILPPAYLPGAFEYLGFFTINKWAMLGMVNAIFDFRLKQVLQSIFALLLLSGVWLKLSYYFLDKKLGVK